MTNFTLVSPKNTSVRP